MSRLLRHPVTLSTSFNDTAMKTIRGAALASLLALSTSCNDFLDVNTNPNAPQVVSANLYLAPMLHWLVTGPQFDGPDDRQPGGLGRACPR